MTTRRRMVWCLGLIGVLGAMSATAFAATTDWGSAIAVPGLAGEFRFGVSSISCVGAGNCVAVGTIFEVTSPDGPGFVVVEKDGVWGHYSAVPDGVSDDLTSVSCATVGSCAAVGTYFTDDENNRNNEWRAHAFVLNERRGEWGYPSDVPGIKHLDHGTVYASEISCPKPGFCAGGGTYGNGLGNQQQVFLVNEKHGVWQQANEVPGLAALNVGGSARLSSISCASARSCTAGGVYTGKRFHAEHPFVVDEANGVWGKAVELPGFENLARHGRGALTSLSCGGPGFCAAAGTFFDAHGVQQGFVANEKHGIWRKAIEVPDLWKLNLGGMGKHGANVYSISCATVASCAATGSYTDVSANVQAFVVSETRGLWRKAIEIPGSAALNVGGRAEAYSVSCAKAGFCGAGGYYTDSSGTPSYPGQQAFVVSQTNGVWNAAVEVPGYAGLNTGSRGYPGEGGVAQISCTGAAGSCTAAGWYVGSQGGFQSFLTEP